ncbi:hypothetical protein AB1N83_008320, partial [Pleurotus pulmonarius]
RPLMMDVQGPRS